MSTFNPEYDDEVYNITLLHSAGYLPIICDHMQKYGQMALHNDSKVTIPMKNITGLIYSYPNSLQKAHSRRTEGRWAESSWSGGSVAEELGLRPPKRWTYGMMIVTGIR